MLVGNKCDRVTEREVSTQEGSALAKQLNCDFVEASAKACVNVEKAFYDVVRRLRSQRASAPRDLGKGSKPTDGYPTRPYGYDHDRDDRGELADQSALFYDQARGHKAISTAQESEEPRSNAS
ncbi:Protein ras-2 [Friedmanniomyces endolithicus]|uniref:Protein ras-2 n=1 Tax=Friedmanniomyces endolithicus TaxID=329885 RepID=A0A4U0TMX2_9PEZI|nr:Protein ras-2 [Friedmanniomyces endolithicus]